MSFNLSSWLRFDPVLKRLFKYALPYKGQMVLACIYMVGAASMSSLTATLLGKLTDAGFYQQEAWVIVAAPAALIGVTLLYAVSTVMSTYMLTKISQSMLVTLRMELFANVLRLPFPAYLANSTGLVSSKFVNEANIALGGAVSAAVVLIRDSLQVIALFGVLLWQNWKLTLIACIVGPIAGVILRTISKRVKRIVRASQEAIAAVLSRVSESYEAERLVKVSNTYDFEMARFSPINEKIRHLALKKQVMQGLGTPVTQIVTMMGVAVVVAFALFEAQRGALTIGEFITFLSAMLLLMPPLQHLAGLNSTFASISVAGKSIFDLLDMEQEKDTGTHVLENSKGAVVFENVRLRYPGQEMEALKAISISIAPGEHVAFVGLSGSGKTTLMNTVPRFWEVTDGAVRIDGYDVRDCTLSSLRSQIAIVSQNVTLFDATIRENIAYGKPEASDEEITKAVRAAALTDFIASLPEGLNTRVGEAGNLLSGGQKQRVSIARAFLKNAPILILDEATSALDSESEHQIKLAIDELMQGRTCLIVAHRLSTIDNADRIVVMSKGEVVESGTPKELLDKGGAYADLYNLQMRSGQNA
ncbi:lipid A export permease/ATP-binding protein MsbA [Sutterella seckii]|uniref:Lipid A export permease/ATP-binding protein MsbA n=1 Tax=Sutterella seckii TaxID=1944635 RepID=A0A6I1EPU6_9BURK|nr:lipid A export permease/ATP-binding protein MsbA [Sutterella seckii]KAB7653919.1 lipid A export permease/ATP-binding protein MsbA [Sutterella seckii]